MDQERTRTQYIKNILINLNKSLKEKE